METLLLQFFSALVGGLVVYVFGVRKSSVELRNTFVQKQMSEFYSPIAGYRKRIRAKSEVRVKVSAATGEAWTEFSTAYADARRPMLNHEQLYAPFGKVIDYDDRQFREELMPLYRKTLDLFTEKYWLADEDTRAYYQGYLEFVEVWERHLAEALPGKVLQKLDHSEENVRPFYDHIEVRLSALQEEVRATSLWKLRL